MKYLAHHSPGSMGQYARVSVNAVSRFRGN